MAIQASNDNSSTTDPKVILTVNNGDLSALKDVLTKTRFINEEAFLRYALVALLRAEDGRVYIKQNGEIVALRPDDSLIKPVES